ncbi:hypothetical protein KP509_21G035800 [Ceratopteris richardii]|uniref:Uncharacterized protein n=1 Tax=Ceratopteris richardii TaxID=49495 RepID=A0A8T2SC97_CERRI|nr:hypothetical protein KP509_21G035800 [Ceratopteris richardii]
MPQKDLRFAGQRRVSNSHGFWISWICRASLLSHIDRNFHVTTYQAFRASSLPIFALGGMMRSVRVSRDASMVENYFQTPSQACHEENFWQACFAQASQSRCKL